MKKFLLFITCMAAFSAQSQVVSVATARTQADGTTATVRGIITNGSEFGGSTRYLQDATGGITLYSGTLSGVDRGDSIEATGIVAPYNNLFELTPISSYTVISSGNPLPTPQLITLTSGYAESYEGELVQVNNVSFTNSGTFAGNTNYNITDGGTTTQIRINSSSNLVGTPIPTGNVNLVGIMSQFNATYQLLLRDLNDILVNGNPPVLTTSLSQSNITTNSFTVSFSTQNNGNTIIRYGLTSNNLNLNITDNTQATTHTANLTGLQPATIYYVQGVTVSSTNDTSVSSIQAMATASLSTGTITTYFNRPVDNTYSSGTNAVYLNQLLDDTLIAYIGRAEQTLDVAIYNIDNANNIITAINQAAANGVTVRVVYDNGVSSGNVSTFINQVQKIASPTGSTYGIMHNKMVIIDANSSNATKPIYWTGSANFTDDQVNSDAQDVIIFQDQSIAKAATLEFNEMFGNTFGPDKSDNTPHEFVIGGKRVEMYFSPSDVVNIKLKKVLEDANNSIQFSVFAFTRSEQAYAVTDAIDNGVLAQGLVESPIDSFVNTILSPEMNNNLKIDNNGYQVHHKYAVVDAFDVNSDPLVFTGSFNWSNSATQRNDENVVIVHDATIANIYFQEWAQRFEDAGGVVIVGTNDIESMNAQILLYPNPTNDNLNIKYILPVNEKVEFKMFDMTGRLVKQWETSSANGNDLVELNDLTNGLYLLNVSGKSVNRTVRLEKQ